MTTSPHLVRSASLDALPTELLLVDTLQLYRFQLDGALPAGAEHVLNETERARAQRFAFMRDRHRFQMSRWMLRSILASLLGMKPALVPIEIGEHGKPFLALSNTLAFNLSHSADHGLLLVARLSEMSNDVGADIEEIKLDKDFAGLAKTVFSDEELAEFAEVAEVADAARARAFFAGWARKEAYLKATGSGFLKEPRTVTVGLSNAPVQIARPGGLEPLQVISVLLDASCAAAIAAPRSARHIATYFIV